MHYYDVYKFQKLNNLIIKMMMDIINLQVSIDFLKSCYLLSKQLCTPFLKFLSGKHYNLYIFIQLKD